MSQTILVIGLLVCFSIQLNLHVQLSHAVCVTGNAWAAAGMLRVLATIQTSSFSSAMSSEQSDLEAWVSEIHRGMYPHLDPNSNLFFNYADEANKPNAFLDGASTALLASTVYRLSLLRSVHTFLPTAEKCRKALFTSSSSSSSSSSSNFTDFTHFSSDGWLTPVVNPDSFGAEGSDSPESEAFVLDLQAAWTEWVQGGSQGANSARTSRIEAREIVSVLITVLFVWCVL